ncbi:unnamed protein product [Cuscuta epithymum]|uniref:Uncharacterized protein n=1 Tax=Cuscuta epithymum TaxID=186058 RepID=A0AAV0BUU3_9ASTE|nr:unnamed protein product [Cuscuta epithymum]
MVNGLPEQYDTIATFIQQANPLPPFHTARSMLRLEETRKTTHANSPATALVHTGNPPPPPPPDVRAPRGRSNTRGGRGRSSSRGGRGRGRSDPQPTAGPQWPFAPPPWAYWMPPTPWNTPPCPYPTTAWPGQSSPRPNSGAGILGPRPQQAHFTASTNPGLVPTDLHTAMQTMSLAPPDDQWYMDTGATSHMTANPVRAHNS